MFTKNKYDYLSGYITSINVTLLGNQFFKVIEDQITFCENKLNFKFPNQLRSFYLQIGYGFFKCKIGLQPNVDDKSTYYSNRLMDPQSIADILLLGYDSGQLHPEAEFEEGDLPFFEIGEGRDFLLMRPKSDNPNAVYDMCGTLIENSFDHFIWRLYYEDPTFYLNVK